MVYDLGREMLPEWLQEALRLGVVNWAEAHCLWSEQLLQGVPEHAVPLYVSPALQPALDRVMLWAGEPLVPGCHPQPPLLQ